MNNITVLIPTSPIPSHPSTKILDETIANIRKYTDAKIIIMFDGVHKSLEHRREVYKEYHENVMLRAEGGLYGQCQLLKFHDHNHQAMMTRYALGNLVKTPLILFCEHDTSPIGDIPFDDICTLLEYDGGLKSSDRVNYIRFNIFDKIPDEHKYLMLGQGVARHFYVGGNDITDIHIPLTLTIQWSQRPHIARTDWYKHILKTYFDKTPISMIEDVMHSVVQTTYSELGKDVFGLAIYTPEGNQLRSYHADGRESDEKIILG